MTAPSLDVNPAKVFKLQKKGSLPVLKSFVFIESYYLKFEILILFFKI